MKSRVASPLAVEQWPLVDRLCWQRAISGDPLAPDGGGGGTQWRDSSRRAVAVGYGAWLGWLSSVGALDLEASPAARATRDRVIDYHRAMKEVGLADHTRAGRLQTLGDALRVMEPDVDTSFLGKAAGKIRSRAVRARPLQPRLRPPEEVVGLGLDLMRRGHEDEALRPYDRALLFRDGLLIALWVCRPLRIANLASLDLASNLKLVEKRHWLEFDEAEMKGRRPYHCSWPSFLEEPLAEYLAEHRPVLLARAKDPAPETRLWITQFGRRFTQNSAGQMIGLRTRAAFGSAINPHLMRYIIATYVAESQPEQIADVAAILGHASLETSEQHYIMAGSFHATAKLQAALLERMAGPRVRGSLSSSGDPR